MYSDCHSWSLWVTAPAGACQLAAWWEAEGTAARRGDSEAEVRARRRRSAAARLRRKIPCKARSCPKAPTAPGTPVDGWQQHAPAHRFFAKRAHDRWGDGVGSPGRAGGRSSCITLGATPKQAGPPRLHLQTDASGARRPHPDLMIGRWSWLAPMPWWPLALLTYLCTVGAILITTLAVGNDPRDDLPMVLAVAAVASCAGAYVNTRRRNQDRAALREAAAHHGDDAYAAEQVARRGTPPTSSSERELALAMINLRCREVGGYLMPAVLAGAALVWVYLAVTSSGWWAALSTLAAAAAGASFRVNRALTRRSDQLSPGLRALDIPSA